MTPIVKMYWNHVPCLPNKPDTEFLFPRLKPSEYKFDCYIDNISHHNCDYPINRQRSSFYEIKTCLLSANPSVLRNMLVFGIGKTANKSRCRFTETDTEGPHSYGLYSEGDCAGRSDVDELLRNNFIKLEVVYVIRPPERCK